MNVFPYECSQSSAYIPIMENFIYPGAKECGINVLTEGQSLQQHLCVAWSSPSWRRGKGPGVPEHPRKRPAHQL